MKGMDGDLLAIGRFGRLTGLTVATLRHWDAEGLLRPAAVDPHTGYRRYRADQEPTARTIAALRDLDLPVGVVRQLFHAEPAVRDDVLRAHRSRLEARAFRLNFALHQLRT
jgi:DNA-binding transcriptional MerR regulator